MICNIDYVCRKITRMLGFLYRVGELVTKPYKIMIRTIINQH